MFQLISKYLLIALSAMVLVAGAQQGLFNKNQSSSPVIAEEGQGVCPAQTCEDKSYCDSGTVVHKHGSWDFNSCTCAYAFDVTSESCGTPPPVVPQVPEPAPVVPAQPAAPSFPCESNSSLCGANQTYCEQTGDNLSEFIFKHEGACHPENGEHDANGCIFIYTPQAPVYHNNTCSLETPPQPPAPPVTPCTADADTGRRTTDSNGCTRNIQTRADCSEYDGGPYSCPSTPPTPPAPGQKLTCYICDLNRPAGDQRRIFGASNSYDSCNGVNGGEGNPSTDSSQSLCQTVTPPTPPPTTPPIICTPPMTLVNGLCQPPVSCPLGTTLTNGICQPNTVCPVGTLLTNGVCQPSTVCPAGTTLTNGVCQPPVVPGQGSTNITNNNTNSNTNSNTNTITISNPAPQVITAQAAPANFGNVGVGTSVVYTQGVQYVPAALPKTGLPEIAWSVLAFIPAGFKLRRFSKVKGDLENHPSYIWENRQFKA